MERDRGRGSSGRKTSLARRGCVRAATEARGDATANTPGGAVRGQPLAKKCLFAMLLFAQTIVFRKFPVRSRRMRFPGKEDACWRNFMS